MIAEIKFDNLSSVKGIKLSHCCESFEEKNNVISIVGDFKYLVWLEIVFQVPFIDTKHVIHGSRM